MGVHHQNTDYASHGLHNEPLIVESQKYCEVYTTLFLADGASKNMLVMYLKFVTAQNKGTSDNSWTQELISY